MRRQPVLIVMSVLAALQVLTGGAALADVIGAEAAGLAVLVVAAAQVGMAYYVRGEVVPVDRAQELVDAAARTGLSTTVATTRVGEDPYAPRDGGWLAVNAAAVVLGVLVVLVVAASLVSEVLLR